jgi:hypothetical protein
MVHVHTGQPQSYISSLSTMDTWMGNTLNAGDKARPSYIRGLRYNRFHSLRNREILLFALLRLVRRRGLSYDSRAC